VKNLNFVLKFVGKGENWVTEMSLEVDKAVDVRYKVLESRN
jgi:hypothetical protein